MRNVNGLKCISAPHHTAASHRHTYVLRAAGFGYRDDYGAVSAGAFLDGLPGPLLRRRGATGAARGRRRPLPRLSVGHTALSQDAAGKSWAL